MSDKTPAGDENLEPVEPDVTDSDVDGGALAKDDAPARPVIKRRTAQAPVRRRTPHDDDRDIEKLEENFTPEEKRAARDAQTPRRRKPVARKKVEHSPDEEANPYSTKNPGVFVKQSVGELKKVVWPTRKEMSGYFLAVLVFVLFIIAYVLLLDLIYGWALLGLLGG